MQRLVIEKMDYFLDNVFDPYAFTMTMDQATCTGAFVCHTSGTTGIPKPCVYTHEFMLRVARTFYLAPPNGYTSLQAQLGHNSHILLLPLFHPAGVQLGIINAIYNRCVVILPSWTVPPSIEGLLAILQQIEADWAMLSPFTLEALAKDAEMLATAASRLNMIVFSGGSLPKPLGDIIAKDIRLASFLGSSETAGLPIIYPPDLDFSKDWDYMCFHPGIGAVLEPRDEGTFELVLKRSPSAELYQPVFDRFPELESFATGDLFKPHPTRRDLWTHASRADDIIVFLNGEKTNPVSFESHLTKHPDIEGALVFGSQRFEAGLIIELKDRTPLTAQTKINWVRKLWPTIEEANRDAPAHARVATSHVLFTETDKPFLRTPKGTIMRKATLGLYSEEIDGLYRAVETIGSDLAKASTNKVVIDDQEALLRVIREACEESMALVNVENDTELLASGVDSLQVLRLCRSLKSKIQMEDLKPATIYQNPSPLKLAKVIHKMASIQDGPEVENDQERKARLENTLTFFTRRIDELARTGPPKQSNESTNGRHVCLVTGTTGSIGSYILRSLLENENIGTIYCLNRGPDSSTRQRQRNRETDPQLPTNFPKTVVFLEGNLSEESFQLDEDIFEVLSSSVTLIIHNAWSVDFNLPLSSFMHHLQGVQNLCRFSVKSSQQQTLMYISSVSAVMNRGLRSGQAVPEEILDDFSASAAGGYAESKYLAERILGYASRKLNMPVVLARVGQVCGALHSTGRWNPKEWIPRLISGSLELRAVPDSLGQYDRDIMDVDWIPVDVLADTVVEILLGECAAVFDGRISPRARVYHLANTRPTCWADMVPTILNILNQVKRTMSQEEGEIDSSVIAVTRQEWLRRLRLAADKPTNANDEKAPEDLNPAVRLIDFYEQKFADESCPVWETGNAVAASSCLRQLGSISQENLEKWIKMWF